MPELPGGAAIQATKTPNYAGAGRARPAKAREKHCVPPRKAKKCDHGFAPVQAGDPLPDQICNARYSVMGRARSHTGSKADRNWRARAGASSRVSPSKRWPSLRK
ncbi:hypothetical protein SAMN02745674_00420 [Lysobacter spongiicola DSM 21749]|uniref:Uncharacterized protein n=1 Tax=Lysobacter spongiicola DSM 21749 TaxID=1122188 RepID=A0A1T4MGN5_9GAMM|nr:hypothetical protein SAMN02745674_00420 [Lysobacter spongiicola DSM 21749]